jgi:hypothetical protein
MIIVQEIKHLFVDFDVADCTFSDDELFRIEVDILSGLSETGAGLFLWCTVLELRYSEGTLSPAELRMATHADWLVDRLELSCRYE